MAPSLLFKRLLKILHIALFFVLVSIAAQAHAQSVLLPGDVVVVTANAEEPSVDFIPLVDIKAGTELFLSGSQWVDSTQTFAHDNRLKLTFQKNVEAGTNIHVGKQREVLIKTEGQLSFNEEAHRLFVYQEEQEMYRFIFGLGWGTGNIWNEEDLQTANGSDIPKSLSEHPHAILTLGEASNQQYYVRNGASGTQKLLQKLVGNASHWKGSDEQAYQKFGIPFNVLTPPVILFDETVSTVTEADSSAILKVAIYEHDGSRLLVDVVFDSTRSIISHEDLNNFRSKTLNFTGLIGDGVYEVHVPISNDRGFEGRETAFFSLKNLSKGNRGDFITHSLIVEEERIPKVMISDIELKEDRIAFIQISNKEDAPVFLKGWKMVSGEREYVFSEDIVLGPGESIKLHQAPKADDVKYHIEIPLLDTTGGALELLDADDQQVDEVTYSKKKESGLNKSVETERPSTNQLAGQESKRQAVESATASSQITAEDGSRWSVLPSSQSLSASFPKKTFYFWSEADQQLISAEDETGSPQTQLGYFTADEAEKLDELESSSRLKGKEPQTLSFSISATDANENEKIDGLEGLNLLYNSWDEPLPVHALVEYLNQKLSKINGNPVLYGIQKNERGEIQFLPLTAEDEVPAKAPFWMLIENEIEPQVVQISKDDWQPQVTGVHQQEELNEEASTIEFTIRSNHQKETLTVNFDENGSVENIKNLSFYPSLWLNLNSFVRTSFAYQDEFYRKLALSTQLQKPISVPIGLATSKSRQMNFSVTAWEHIPENWVVQVEDRLLGKKHKLTKGSAFNFDFRVQADKPNEVEPSTPIKPVDLDKEHRFVLHITPPEANADALDEEDSQPREVELHQNFPNPFNPVTTISFYLPESKEVKLSVFNIVGQPVAVITEGNVAAGMHHYEWDAADKPSGMYIYQLEVGKSVITRKMTLVK